MILQFQKEIAFPKTGAVFISRFFCFLVQAAHQIPLHFPGKAGAKRNNPFVVLPQRFHIHSRFIIVAVDKAFGYNFDQVGVALIVFGEEHQMVIAVFAVRGFPVKAGIGGDIDFAAYYRSDPCGLGGFIKVDHAVHYAMIGNSRSVHAQFLYSGNIFVNFV